jgi:transcriptional regulator of acetoin/glycerol metabolism
VPWLLQLVAQPRDRALHVSLVEEALVREWPSNVRELLSATLQAVSREREGPVLAEHLPAPMVFQRERPAETEATRPEDVTKQMVVDALAKADGNATLAAKLLGLHRTQLNRLRAKFGITK